MGLNSILAGGTTGLLAAQAGLRVVSDNISNVNTVGYVRKTLQQAPLVAGNESAGVEVTGVKRAADEFLRAASLQAQGKFSQASVTESMLDRAQAAFGDPSEKTSFFTRLDDIYAAFSQAAEDPSSTLLRSNAITAATQFVSDASTINQTISSLISEADSTITGDLDQVNGLLDQIDALNSDITKISSAGEDASGAQGLQDLALDDLSKLIGISVSRRPLGGVTLRTVDGVPLTGDGGARLSYVINQGGHGGIEMTVPGSSTQPLRGALGSGSVNGLLSLRNKELPALQDQVSEFVSKSVEELNRAHNAGAASPPPQTLTGRDTGLDLPTAVDGFTGTTNIGITDSSGNLQRKITIAFNGTGGSMSVDGGAATAFTSANFLTSLNTALGATATASFTDHALTLSAASGSGVAIAEDPTTPSTKAGKAFSHFFGLNDLVTSNGPSSYDTGLRATDPHGFTAGDSLTLRVLDANSSRVREVSVAVPAATTMQDLVNSLNSNTTGVGMFGSFALDSKGAMRFTPTPGSGTSVMVVSDSTERGANGPSISRLFGVGVNERTSRVERLSVNSQLLGDDRKLALSTLDLTAAAAGKSAVVPGDSRNGIALAKAGENIASYDAVGNLAATTMSVGRYASELSGAVGRRSAQAQQTRESAEALSTEAKARRAGAEGVNLDEELISMTIYQQAYNASARLLTAATEMYDTLLSMGR